MSNCLPTQFIDYMNSFDSVIREYIPKQLLEEYDKMDVSKLCDGGRIRMILENAKNNLRMYGTPEESQANLRLYWDFPLNFSRFNVEFSCTTPTKHRNLKGELFYCKQELVRHLQAATRTSFRKMNEKVPEEFDEDMMNHRDHLSECYEFVKYNERIFDELKATFYYSEKLEDVPLQHETNCDAKEMKFDAKHYPKRFEKLIAKYPEVFLRNNIANTKNNPSVVVRIFEDDQEKFVMETELFNAINILNPNNNSLESNNKNGILRTMNLKEVFTTYRDDIKGIDFIRFPIIRTKHAAVPIVTPTGGHCILISDFIIETIRRLIFGLNIFQKLNKDTWYLMEELINVIVETVFKYVNCISFIELDVVDELKKRTDKFWVMNDMNNTKSNVVEVKDVGRKGFTLEDLKKELKRLGLDECFLENSFYAGAAYSCVTEDKNSEKLRTCDMFDALEYCQMICFTDRFPNLLKIIHIQSACHRIPHRKSTLCPTMVTSPLKLDDNSMEKDDIAEEKQRKCSVEKSEAPKDLSSSNNDFEMNSSASESLVLHEKISDELVNPENTTKEAMEDCDDYQEGEEEEQIVICEEKISKLQETLKEMEKRVDLATEIAAKNEMNETNESLVIENFYKRLEKVEEDYKLIDFTNDLLKETEKKNEQLEKKMLQKDEEIMQLKQGKMKLLKSKENEFELLKRR